MHEIDRITVEIGQQRLDPPLAGHRDLRIRGFLPGVWDNKCRAGNIYGTALPWRDPALCDPHGKTRGVERQRPLALLGHRQGPGIAHPRPVKGGIQEDDGPRFVFLRTQGELAIGDCPVLDIPDDPVSRARGQTRRPEADQPLGRQRAELAVQSIGPGVPGRGQLARHAQWHLWIIDPEPPQIQLERIEREAEIKLGAVQRQWRLEQRVRRGLDFAELHLPQHLRRDTAFQIGQRRAPVRNRADQLAVH